MKVISQILRKDLVVSDLPIDTRPDFPKVNNWENALRGDNPPTP